MSPTAAAPAADTAAVKDEMEAALRARMGDKRKVRVHTVTHEFKGRVTKVGGGAVTLYEPADPISPANRPACEVTVRVDAVNAVEHDPEEKPE